MTCSFNSHSWLRFFFFFFLLKNVNLYPIKYFRETIYFHSRNFHDFKFSMIFKDFDFHDFLKGILISLILKDLNCQVS